MINLADYALNNRAAGKVFYCSAGDWRYFCL